MDSMGFEKWEAMNIKSEHTRLMIRMYNKMSGKQVSVLSEIPAESLRLLYLFDSKELVAPLIRLGLVKGDSQKKVARDCGVSRSAVQKIGSKAGLCAR